MGPLRKWFLDIVFPRQCLGCETLISGDEESYVCRKCLAGVRIKNDFACAFCGSPVIMGKTCPFCGADHFLDRLWVATSYENPLVEKILKTMKYRFVKSLAGDVAGLMAKYLKRRLASCLDICSNSVIVVPVPLHRLRLNWRGFNQAEVIGQKIADLLNWPLVVDALKRDYQRKPQAQITDRESRISNVKEIFRCLNPEAAGGKTVVLIDDIATTGSTLNDCARALKGAGAKEVAGFVFAKGTFASDKKLLQ
jgi:ComF family protein